MQDSGIVTKRFFNQSPGEYSTQLSCDTAHFGSIWSIPLDLNLLLDVDGILPKGPYLPCLRMADRALLAGYPRYISWLMASEWTPSGSVTWSSVASASWPTLSFSSIQLWLGIQQKQTCHSVPIGGSWYGNEMVLNIFALNRLEAGHWVRVNIMSYWIHVSIMDQCQNDGCSLCSKNCVVTKEYLGQVVTSCLPVLDISFDDSRCPRYLSKIRHCILRYVICQDTHWNYFLLVIHLLTPSVKLCLFGSHSCGPGLGATSAILG